MKHNIAKQFEVPVSLDSAQEELRAVGVGAGVGHREDAGAFVLELAANRSHRSQVPKRAHDQEAVNLHVLIHGIRTLSSAGAYKFSSSNLAP